MVTALTALPQALRPYVILVAALGPAAVATALASEPVNLSPADVGRGALLTALAALTLRHPLRLSHRTRVDVATIPLLAIVLVFPVGVAGLLALIALVAGQRSLHKDPVEALFNVGQGSFSIALAAGCPAAVRDWDVLGPQVGGFGPIGAVVLAAAVLDLANTVLVMGAVLLEFGVQPTHVSWRTVTDDAPAHAVMSILGVVAAVLAVDHPIALPVLMLPAALVHRSLQETIRVRADTHDALAALIDVIELRDPYTSGHSRRVAATAHALAFRLGLSPEEADAIEVAGRVHDLGKAALDPALLTKSGQLTEAEWEQMRQHPVIGADVVARFAAYADGHRLVRHHHEAWDGSGYPDGLAGEDIPLGARILAVADAFDAMTSDRAYRSAKSAATALRILEEGAGRQWDPRVVAAMVDYLGEAAAARDSSWPAARPVTRAVS